MLFYYSFKLFSFGFEKFVSLTTKNDICGKVFEPVQSTPGQQQWPILLNPERNPKGRKYQENALCECQSFLKVNVFRQYRAISDDEWMCCQGSGDLGQNVTWHELYDPWVLFPLNWRSPYVCVWIHVNVHVSMCVVGCMHVCVWELILLCKSTFSFLSYFFPYDHELKFGKYWFSLSALFPVS